MFLSSCLPFAPDVVLLRLRLSRSSIAGEMSFSSPDPPRESDSPPQLLSLSPPAALLGFTGESCPFLLRSAGSVEGLVIGDSPPIEDVFALISPRLCAPLHHCVPLDPPKHLSVFPLAHPSVSYTHMHTYTHARAAAERTFLAILQYPLPPRCTLRHRSHSHAQAHASRARAHGRWRALPSA